MSPSPLPSSPRLGQVPHGVLAAQLTLCFLPLVKTRNSYYKHHFSSFKISRLLMANLALDLILLSSQQPGAAIIVFIITIAVDYHNLSSWSI